MCRCHRFLDPRAVARGQWERPLLEAGLPVTSLHGAAATGQRLVQRPGDRGLKSLVLGGLDDVLIAERMVHAGGQPTRERHREFRRRVGDLDPRERGTLPARRCRCPWRRGAAETDSGERHAFFPQARRQFFEHLQGACWRRDLIAHDPAEPVGDRFSQRRCSPMLVFPQILEDAPLLEQLEPGAELAFAVVSRLGPGMAQERHREGRIAGDDPLAVGAARLPELVRRPAHRGRVDHLLQPLLEFLVAIESRRLRQLGEVLGQGRPGRHAAARPAHAEVAEDRERFLRRIRDSANRCRNRTAHCPRGSPRARTPGRRRGGVRGRTGGRGPARLPAIW